MIHAMIDIETLGTAADCIVLSVGCVRFTLDGLETDAPPLYVRVDMGEQLAAGRTLSPPTLKWWFGQEKAAQEALFDVRTPLVRIMELRVRLENHLIGVDRIWAHGAHFDIAILDHMFRGLSSPWSFRDVRDDRTIWDLVDGDPHFTERTPRAGVAHNALDDARTQALSLIAALRHLKSLGVVLPNA